MCTNWRQAEESSAKSRNARTHYLSLVLRGLPVRGRLVLAATCGTVLLPLPTMLSTLLPSLVPPAAAASPPLPPPPLLLPLPSLLEQHLEVVVLDLLTLLLASASPAADMMSWCAASMSA